MEPPQVKVSSSGWAKANNTVRDMKGLLSETAYEVTCHFSISNNHYTLLPFRQCSFLNNWCILGNGLIGIIYFGVVKRWHSKRKKPKNRRFRKVKRRMSSHRRRR